MNITQNNTENATAGENCGILHRNTLRRDRIALELFGKPYGSLPEDGCEQDHVMHLLESGYDPALVQLHAAAPDLLAAVIYAEAMAEMEIDELRKTWDEESMPVQAAIIARDKYRPAIAFSNGGVK